MKGSWTITRRSVVLLATSWLLDRSVGRLLAREAACTLGEVQPSRVLACSKFRSRQYVVSATVILGSIPIFTKAKVGGALLTIEEAGTDTCGVTGLQFGAGSWPDQLNGFNRFGLTQELVKRENCTITESTYLSFMTPCHEASFSVAQRAFGSTGQSLAVTIAHGHSTASGYTSKIVHQTVPAKLSWVDCPKLTDELRGRLAPLSVGITHIDTERALPTFLYAVRRALCSDPQDGATLFAHDAKVYSLSTHREHDSRSGGRVFTARTSQQGSRAESRFRIWMASDAEQDLPLRIEFRPNSYLKLTLEAGDTQSRPVFKRLFEPAQL